MSRRIARKAEGWLAAVCLCACAGAAGAQERQPEPPADDLLARTEAATTLSQTRERVRERIALIKQRQTAAAEYRELQRLCDGLEVPACRNVPAPPDPEPATGPDDGAGEGHAQRSAVRYEVVTISGAHGRLTAVVRVHAGGRVEHRRVRQGSVLPGGLRVSAVQRYGVVVADGDRVLPMAGAAARTRGDGDAR